MRTLNVELSDDQIIIDLKIKTLDPRGDLIQQTLTSIVFPKGMKKMRFRVVMAGLSFTIPGNYLHQIELGNSTRVDFKKILEIPFEILEKKPK